MFNKTTEANLQRIEKNESIFVCKRIKLYTYLFEKGFRSIAVTQDARKTNYVNWLFKSSPELQEAVKQYYSNY